MKTIGILIACFFVVASSQKQKLQQQWAQVASSYHQQQPVAYYLNNQDVAGQDRQTVVHPNQPAHAGVISALPASSPQQQAQWDNAAPIVVNSNNRSPGQIFYISPNWDGASQNQWADGGQQWGVGGQQWAVVNSGEHQYSPSLSVVGNQGWAGAQDQSWAGVQDQSWATQNGQKLYVVVNDQATQGGQVVVQDAQHSPAQEVVVRRNHQVNYIQPGQVGGGHLYAVLSNVHGDTVVTNQEQPSAALPAVNFENLRPGNVRRLEEPLDTPVYHDGGDNVDASFDDAIETNARQNAPSRTVLNVRNSGKANFATRDEQQAVTQEEQQQQQEQQPEVKTRQVVIVRQEPVKTAPFRFGQRRAIQVQPVAWNYGTKSVKTQYVQKTTLEPEPAPAATKQQVQY